MNKQEIREQWQRIQQHIQQYKEDPLARKSHH